MNRFLAATALTAAFALPLAAQTMTDAERDAFRAEVRSYLLENPEVLAEAFQELENRQQAAAVQNDKALLQTHAEAIYNDPASWVGGNPQGDITLVEFMDYRCGYCKKAHPEVFELIKSDGNIKIVIKEFPILGEASELAARFAISVLQLEGPEAYEKLHDALITLRAEISPESLSRAAEASGVKDIEAVKAHMSDAAVTAVIAANRELATLLQINGTPSFIMQGQMLRGYVPLEGMRQIVEQERAG